NRERREILALRKEPNAGSHRIHSQFRGWNTTHYADIVVWTRLDAVETKSAIEVAGLARLKQCQLTTTLNDDQGGCRLAHTAYAVFRCATSAGVLIANRDFEWRCSRGDKVKLSDRADKLAER